LILKTIYIFFILFFVQNSLFGQYLFALGRKNSTIKNTDFEVVGVRNSTKNSSKYFGELYVNERQKQKVGFEIGIEKSIENYYKSYNLGSKKVKVLVNITHLNISEDLNNNKQISGNIKYDIEGFFINDNDTTKFCNSRNSAKYTRTLQASMLPNVEKQIIEAIDSGLKFIIGYIKNSKSNLEAFATESRVIIRPFYSQPNADTVYYQQRKVNWSDFEGPIRNNNHYGAAIFTSFAFDSKVTVENNIIIAEITPKVYTDKNMSWAKPGIKTPYALSHEQLHFDICYLNTLKFLEKIKTFKEDTRDDLISRIQYEYLEFYKKTHKMQTEYDEETNHSLVKHKQIEWEDKIKSAIREFDLLKIFN
jgi:hypothetical protein